MASLFGNPPRDVRLLDAGAGAGALTSATVDRWVASRRKPRTITATAYEADPLIIPQLERTLSDCEAVCAAAGVEFRFQIHVEDFIGAAIGTVRRDLFSSSEGRFHAAILNPPYRKIHSHSAARLLLRSAGIETSNLYTGFLALAAELLHDGGELVTITPRSFCNGPYFRSFRARFLSQMSLRRLHLLDSRTSAFRENDVLQENVILHAVKSARPPERVWVSSSPGVPARDVQLRETPYSEIVRPDDPEQFVHLVTDDTQKRARQSIRQVTCSLKLLALQVSTGRVVDFRARPYLLSEPTASSFPLIYPCHFGGSYVEWPLAQSRKPNAICDTEGTRDLLVERGIYVLVKRFTSKEERRRVVACIYDSGRIPSAKVGFENHLNYFHANGKSLPMNLAKGLAAWLNSSIVDSYFRQFNGHTQVNATDLRNMPYPTEAQLTALGNRFPSAQPTQAEIDRLVSNTLL